MIAGEIVVLRPVAYGVPPGISLPAGPAGPVGPPGLTGTNGANGSPGAPGVIQTVNGKTGVGITLTGADLGLTVVSDSTGLTLSPQAAINLAAALGGSVELRGSVQAISA